MFLCFGGCVCVFIRGCFCQKTPRRSSAGIPHAIRTVLRTCSALAPHLPRTCSALAPNLCRTYAALVPHSFRNVGGSAARRPLEKTGFCAAKPVFFAQPARRLSAIQSGFRVLEAKTRLFLMAHSRRIIFRAKPRKTGNPALRRAKISSPRLKINSFPSCPTQSSTNTGDAALNFPALLARRFHGVRLINGRSLVVVKETKGRTFWHGRIAREWR